MEWFRLREWFTPGKSQGFLVLLAGLLVSVFAGILITSTPVYAADATWDANGNITKDGTVHKSVTDRDAIRGMGLNQDALVFASDHNASPSASGQTVSVIHFPRNTDLSTETSATQDEYTYTPPNTWSRTNQSTIAIDSSSYSQLSTGSNCNVDQIGWMVCGPSVWIANGVDSIYGWIEDFLTVRELEVGNQSSTQYQAWNIMRGIANAAFIVAFLVIIYSQVSSIGISNYGIKKLVPRLVLAAILVNVSFLICAIAIDLSNILGHTLKQLFDDMYNSLVATGGSDNEGMLSASSIVQAVLSGGILAVGGGIAVGGSLLAATPLVLPLLLTVFVGLLVALVVFAARQALVVILTIIAPVAFVCYLLPGTEKWFEKWRSTFFTMLFFFPAFAVVFGGAKLAGMLIISNASTIVMVVIGWAVQLAPLALAPLVLKLGGGILNRFAGIVNDPSKGMIDKTRQWAQNKSKVMSIDSYDKMMARREGWKRDGSRLKKAYGGIHGGARRLARGAQNSGRLLRDQVSRAEKSAENQYHSTDKFRQFDIGRRETEQASQVIDKQLDLDWNTHLKVDAKALEKDLILRVKTDQVELSNQELNNRYAEFKGGRQPFIGPMTESMTNLIEDAQTATEHLAVEGLRQNNAQRALNAKMANTMLKNTDLQKRAASIYEFGQDAAIASAISTMRQDLAKSVEEGSQIVKHFELSAEQRQAHAMGAEEFRVTKPDGTHYDFKNTGVFTREHAIEEQMIVGTVSQVSEILSASGTELAGFRSTISSALAKSGVKGKAPFLGGKLINDVAKGDIRSEADLQSYVVEWIQGGKFKPSDVSIIDKEGLELVINSLGTEGSATRAQIGEDRLKGLRKKIEEVFRNPELHANVADNAVVKFKALRNSLPEPDPTTTNELD